MIPIPIIKSAFKTPRPIKYLYVFTANSATTILKYDLDGNLLSSNTETVITFPPKQSGNIDMIARVHKASGNIFVSRVDSFGSPTTDTPTQIFRLTPNTTIGSAISEITPGGSYNNIWDIAIDDNFIWVARQRYRNTDIPGEIMTFDLNMNKISGYIFPVGEGGTGAYIFPESKFLIDGQNVFFSDLNKFSSFVRGDSLINRNFVRYRTTPVFFAANSLFILPKSEFVYVSEGVITSKFPKDNSTTMVRNVPDLGTTIRDNFVLYNGDYIRGNGTNIVSVKSEDIIIGNPSPPINFSINLDGTQIQSICKDDSDNIYVLTANFLRKLSATGSIIWSEPISGSASYVVANTI